MAHWNYKKSRYDLYSGLPSLKKLIGNMDSQYIIITIVFYSKYPVNFQNN